jgi:hypothetical protein
MVVLNFSGQSRQFKIADDQINGHAENVFEGKDQNLDQNQVFYLKPWDWLVFDYRSN